MLSHAVQGMQPNLVRVKPFSSSDGQALMFTLFARRQIARRWNFVFFTSTPPTSDLLSEENVKKRTRAIMMEFETNVSSPLAVEVLF